MMWWGGINTTLHCGGWVCAGVGCSYGLAQQGYELLELPQRIGPLGLDPNVLQRYRLLFAL